MRKNLFLWQFAGFVISTALGTLLHFLYAWTGWIALAPFSAVNESTWEHMKILFFPMLFFAIFQSFFAKGYADFWQVKAVGIAVGVVAIPVLFYTYGGAFGAPPAWLNVLFFFAAAAVGCAVELYLFRGGQGSANGRVLAIVFLGVLAVLFVYYTFRPPMLPLFLDPLTSTYGVFKLK